jgi:hypothetical protein
MERNEWSPSGIAGFKKLYVIEFEFRNERLAAKSGDFPVG